MQPPQVFTRTGKGARAYWLRRAMSIALGLWFSPGCHAESRPQAIVSPTTPSAQPQFFEPPPSALDADHSLTDLSSLNDAPAGTHGFVRVAHGHFEDDRATRLRFFGVNLAGIAALPDPATGHLLAGHFRKLGFNAVRLQALDSPGALLSEDGQFLPGALDRLDHFTAELKEQGIYFSFALHAAASYPGLAGEARARFPEGKVLDRFHPAFLDAQEQFARRFLGHASSLTGLRYVDDPALLYVELCSEDTLFPSPSGSPDDLPADFRAELAAGYGPWLAQRTADGLRAPGPADEEAKGGLPTSRDSAGARADYAQFLYATERRQVARLITFIRDELKLRSMLVNTQVDFGGLAGVLREAELSDFIDIHGVWAPTTAPADTRSAAGQTRDDSGSASQIRAPDAGILAKMAGYRVFGKPFLVSEYRTPAPSDSAAELYPLLIGIAGLQDWDALFAFAYADRKRDYAPRQINGVFDLAGHPAKLAFIPLAASAFRRGLIAAARSRVELEVPEQPSTLPFAADALAGLWQSNGVPPQAAAIHQVGISLRPGPGDLKASPVEVLRVPWSSDTGELLWASEGPHPRLSVDAPSLKLACGMLANSELQFSDVSFSFHDFSPGFACAGLISLDQQPITTAHRLLLTVVGQAQNAHREAGPGRTQSLGTGPALAQFVPVTVSLPGTGWQAAALDATGAPFRSLPVSRSNPAQLTTLYPSAALSYSITR